MKKIFAILAFIAIATTAMAQDISKAGVYNKQGQALVVEAEPCVVNITLRVATDHFTPGIYARYAQKYLGQRATLAEHTTVEVLAGKIGKGAVEATVTTEVEQTKAALPLPENRTSSVAQTTEEQAAATAELIFSLRKHRLDLITGEAGENVFGAGLKSALEEIERLELTYLDMFYGTTLRTEEQHTFNIAIDPAQLDYTVCRISDKVGVVATDDLSAAPVVLHLEPATPKEYDILQPLGPKDKVSEEYLVVAPTKCILINEALLLDSCEMVLLPFAKSVVAKPIK